VNIPIELRHVEYCGYPLPALIYEARNGGASAAYYVYWYFVGCVERGSNIDPDVLKFVSNELKHVLENKQSPNQMIHKNNARRVADTLLVYEEVNHEYMCCKKKKLAYRITGEKMGKSPGAIEKLYKAEKIFQDRIFKVQKLLDHWSVANKNHKSARTTIDELNAIYSDPTTIK